MAPWWGAASRTRPASGSASTGRATSWTSPRRSASLRAGPGDPSWRREPDGTLWWTTTTPRGPRAAAAGDPARAGRGRGLGVGPRRRLAPRRRPGPAGPRRPPDDFRPLPEHPAARCARGTRGRAGGCRAPAGCSTLRARLPRPAGHRRGGGHGLADAAARVRRAGPGRRAEPGGPAHGLRAAPTGAAWRRVPSWEWLQAGVDQHRRAPLLAGAGAPHGLERTLALHRTAEADRPCGRCPGSAGGPRPRCASARTATPTRCPSGTSTSRATSRSRSTGEVMDDDACAEVVRCYARAPVPGAAAARARRGVQRPRRAPRMTLPTHTPARFLRRGASGSSRPRAARCRSRRSGRKRSRARAAGRCRSCPAGAPHPGGPARGRPGRARGRRRRRARRPGRPGRATAPPGGCVAAGSAGTRVRP